MRREGGRARYQMVHVHCRGVGRLSMCTNPRSRPCTARSDRVVVGVGKSCGVKLLEEGGREVVSTFVNASPLLPPLDQKWRSVSKSGPEERWPRLWRRSSAWRVQETSGGSSTKTATLAAERSIPCVCMKDVITKMRTR